MEKNWHEIMKRELDRAGTGAKLIKVDETRKPSQESLNKLEMEIAEAIENNKEMSQRSYINAKNC